MSAHPAPTDRDGKYFVSDRTIAAKFFMTMFHEVMKARNTEWPPQKRSGSIAAP
ncbi:hypothetical protein QN219_09255 [Sinorhizobium sp. 7-81]|uniref:hypothetical protein n=1 Tax=Sinorhizobium sp. 8-89 TaxID=3049089 RepID=UPI0024C28F23|nr:hypothetical protein [Sinorhizobium sp. 8-89]MDK1490247.1 hypothetical protein [Sinorhizobium sp. 8-89]